MGLTQQAFGELIGVAANSVARWERGELGVRESAARLMRLLAKQPPPIQRTKKKRP